MMTYRDNKIISNENFVSSLKYLIKVFLGGKVSLTKSLEFCVKILDKHAVYQRKHNCLS